MQTVNYLWMLEIKREGTNMCVCDFFATIIFIFSGGDRDSTAYLCTLEHSHCMLLIAVAIVVFVVVISSGLSSQSPMIGLLCYGFLLDITHTQSMI